MLELSCPYCPSQPVPYCVPPSHASAQGLSCSGMPRARTDSVIPMAKMLLCCWLRAIAVHSVQQQWPKHGCLFMHILSAPNHPLSRPQVFPFCPVCKSCPDPLVMSHRDQQRLGVWCWLLWCPSWRSWTGWAVGSA